jgi:hypothetical protein
VPPPAQGEGTRWDAHEAGEHVHVFFWRLLTCPSSPADEAITTVIAAFSDSQKAAFNSYMSGAVPQ